MDADQRAGEFSTQLSDQQRENLKLRDRVQQLTDSLWIIAGWDANTAQVFGNIGVREYARKVLNGDD